MSSEPGTDGPDGFYGNFREVLMQFDITNDKYFIIEALYESSINNSILLSDRKDVMDTIYCVVFDKCIARRIHFPEPHETQGSYLDLYKGVINFLTNIICCDNFNGRQAKFDALCRASYHFANKEPEGLSALEVFSPYLFSNYHDTFDHEGILLFCLDLISKILCYMNLNMDSFYEMFNRLMSHSMNNLKVIDIIIKCLSRIIPKSDNETVMIARSIMWIVELYGHNSFSPKSERNSCITITRVFQKFSKIPLLLFTEHTLRSLNRYIDTSDSVIIDTLFRCLKESSTSEMFSTKLYRKHIIPFIKHVWRAPSLKELFVEMAGLDCSFFDHLLKSVDSLDADVYCGLLTININFKLPPAILDKMSPDQIYYICSIIKTIDNSLIQRLHSLIVTTPIEPCYFTKLIPKIPDIVVKNLERLFPLSYHGYTLKKIRSGILEFLSVLKEEESVFALLEGSWKRFIDNEIFWPILGYLLCKRFNSDEDKIEIHDLLNRNKGNLDFWSIPGFVSVALSIESRIINLSFFSSLISKQPIRTIPIAVFDRLLECESTNCFVFEYIIKGMKTWDPLDTSYSYSILRNSSRIIPHIYQKSIHRFSYVLFDLYISKYKLYSLLSHLIFPGKQPRLFHIIHGVIPYLISKLEETKLELLLRYIQEEKRKHTNLSLLYLNDKPDGSTNDNGSDNGKSLKSPLDDSVLKDPSIQAESLIYVLSACDKSELQHISPFIHKIFQSNTYKIVEDSLPEISWRVLLSIGHSDNIKNANHELIGFFSRILINSNAINNETGESVEMNTIRYFMVHQFPKIMFEFGKIINSNYYNKTAVIRTLRMSLSSISNDIGDLYPKMFSLIDIAMENHEIRRECLLFYYDFLQNINHKNILNNVFGRIISQVFPYISEFRDEILNILMLLFHQSTIDIVKPCFPLLYLTPGINSERQIPKEFKNRNLESLKALITQGVQFSDLWPHHLDFLASSIGKASLSLQRFIVNQMIWFIQKNTQFLSQLSINQKSSIIRILWKNLTSSNNSMYQVLCERCISLLPLVKDYDPPKIMINLSTEPKDIIKNIVSGFLFHIFEESTSIFQYDLAAYATMGLLNIIKTKDLSEKHNSSKSKSPKTNPTIEKEYNELIESFPDIVRSVINQFIESSITIEHNFIMIQPDNIFRTHPEFQNWLPSFTSAIFSIPYMENAFENIAKAFSCLIAIFPYSLQLCKFILPYLFYWRQNNESVFSFIKKEYNYLFNIIISGKSDSDEQQQARFALLAIFSAFDSLDQINRNVAKKNIEMKFSLFRISSNKDLYQASLSCQLYDRSLIHIEMDQRENDSSNDLSKETLKTLKKIYRNLGDFDSFETVKKKLFKLSPNFFPFSLGEDFGLAYESNKVSISRISKLVKSGRYEIALSESISIRSIYQCLKLDAMIARSAIHLAKWDALELLIDDSAYNQGEFKPVLQKSQDILYMIDIYIGCSLFFIKSKKIQMFQTVMENVRQMMNSTFLEYSQVSYEKVLPLLSRFRVFEELQSFSQIESISKGFDKLYDSWNEWSKQSFLTSSDFDLLSSVRISIIEICISNKNKYLMDIWLELCKIYRKSGELVKSEVCCTRARSFSQNEDDHCNCIVESAKIFWAKHDTNQAQWVASTIKTTNKNIMGKVLLMRGQWSAETSTLGFNEIFQLYEEASILLVESGKAHYSLASLADQRVFGYICNLEQNPSAASKKAGSNKFWANSMTPSVLSNFLKSNICLALTNYFKAIFYSPQYSHEVVPRLLQLFFDVGQNFISQDSSSEGQILFPSISIHQKELIHQAMAEILNENKGIVKPAIWLNSITQLISRIEQPQKLEAFLFSLIQISVENYVQSSLWQLMFLYHSSVSSRSKKLQLILDGVRKRLNEKDQKNFEQTRTKFERITSSLKELATAETLANKSIEKSSVICPQLVSDLKESLVLLPISSTLFISLIPDEYINQDSLNSSYPKIQSLEESITIFNSLMKPKKITINTNEGRSYSFLCKKDDDLRKDMRMMEFASFVNRILHHNRQCRERNLLITTFAIICLDERCGMIEWVENTTGFRSIIETLIKSKKKGIPTIRLRELLLDGEANNNTNIQNKISNFKYKILPEYPPLLYQWFLSQFPEPSKWYKARLNFTKSTSVWSMVGYIVGLGDRHAENIMINEITGSCVHVDFNCLFDKAKTLNVPECVPFRLTQNFEDAMGVLKTEGVFSNCSIRVMETLRSKKQQLVSVLQTFVHDPLLEWKKGNTVQSGAVSLAKLTLKEVERRLTGFSDDKSTIYSPECQVKELIKQATSIENLAQMYVGWQPYY